MRFSEIPCALIEKWEREAIEQNLPYTEVGEFLKMKEKRWRESQPKADKPRLYVDSSRRLTEYGNSFVLSWLLSMPVEARACKVLKVEFEDLKGRKIKTDEQRENFWLDRQDWFARLKRKMKDLRMSKETLAAYGLNWEACKTFAFQAV